MGRTIEDVDIATNAPWTKTQKLMQGAGIHVIESGTKHGTLTCIVDSMPLEVTTYRSDGEYRDHRHPETVQFVQTIEEDLSRRDFTINALAYHPDRGIIDPFNGKADIEQRLIRTVRNASERFQEDALRILRAVRFCSQLGFSLEENTFSSMLEKAPLLQNISAERMYGELTKFVCGEYVYRALMKCIDVLGAVIPEALSMKDFDQKTPYHIYDVLEHTAYVMHHTPSTPLVRWAAFFHDIGKPATFFADEEGVGHFYGHAKISVDIARKVLRRLKAPHALTSDVLVLVKVHDDAVKPTPKAVKRMMYRLEGRPDLFFALCALKKGDAAAQAPLCSSRIELADTLVMIAQSIIDEEEIFSLKDLAINGTDLMSMGIEPGPRIGALLDKALNAVIDETVANNKEALLAFLNE